MFTVRDAENAMITFTVFATAVIIAICLHERLINRGGFANSLYVLVNNVSNILSAATLLTILEEGSDIMFQRIRSTLKKERQLVAETRAKTEHEVYKEIAEWDQRRREAEARGETFREPVPGSDLPKRKKRRFFFFTA